MGGSAAKNAGSASGVAVLVAFAFTLKMQKIAVTEISEGKQLHRIRRI